MKPQQQNNGELIVEFLKIAIVDLEMAGYLYKKRYYAGARYHLQQCVEKTAKAEALLTNKIKEKDLMGMIGHKTFKINSLNLLKDIRELEDYRSNGELEFEGVLKWLRHLSSKKLKEGYLFYLIYSFLPKKELLKSLNLSNKDYRKLFLRSKDFFDKRVNKKGKILNLGYELFILSLILAPHSQISRYPNTFLSPLKYDQKLGIIQAFKIIEDRMLKVWVLLKKTVIDKYPQFKEELNNL